MTSKLVGRLSDWGPAEQVPTADLTCPQGVGPVASVDALARPDLFEPYEELTEFLADPYAARHAGLA